MTSKKKLLTFYMAAICCLTSCGNVHRNDDLYLNESAPIDARVEDILDRMTLEEKVALCHAQSKFSSPGVQRLGVPELWMNDGPFGVRSEVLYNSWTQAETNNDSCTAFPALTALASSWDIQLAAKYGQALSEEANYREKDVQLAPGINIFRTPLNGRNFEYLGEDPFLVAQMAVPYIRAIQENGVAVCVKHFALNNQEYLRDTINVEVSDRALREIYLPAFRASVQEGGAWSVMGSYNRFRGQHCSHHEYLVNDILKGEWGFDGVLISDWSATKNAYEAAMNGLDIEMGTLKPYNEYYMADSLLYLVSSGKVPETIVDDKARRILKLNLRTAMNRNRPWGSFNSKEHADLARRIAEQGIVLLKNEGSLLPIDTDKYRKIAVIGENAVRKHASNGGAAALKPRYEITPLEGIEARFGKDTEISYARGYSSYNYSLENGYVIPSSYDNEKLADEAVELAAESDLVIFIGGLNHNWHQDSEGYDRDSYGLPYGQPELIGRIREVNENVVLVLVSGTATDLMFTENIPSIVQAWYCGSESGNAIASVLAGDVNPSGKLPISFYAKLEDCGAHAFGPETYPGVDKTVNYTEGIYVGYRWLEAKNIKPLYAFGHGLSYTGFKYGEPVTNKMVYDKDEVVKVSFKVTNTGKIAGAEVSQVYVSQMSPSVDRPVKELKGFAKTFLKAGETAVVEISLPVKDWAFWDEASDGWKLETGEYAISVGAASDDIKYTVNVKVK